MDDPDIQRLYDLVANDLHDEALTLVRSLRDQGRSFPELDLYEGLSIYNKKDDLESLRLLATFALQNPSHRKRAFALFTCAICLINMGLERCALEILEGLPETYPDRDKEIQYCREHLNRQESALELMKGFPIKYKSQRTNEPNRHPLGSAGISPAEQGQVTGDVRQ